jgi:guanylate kinase
MAPTSVTSALRPIILSGPSGVGKSTLVKSLLEKYPSKFALSVSHTTRTPRAGEQHGVHYYFTDRANFEAMLRDSEFLEHAEFSGNYYGTSKQAVADVAKQGKICLLDIEMEGVKQLRNSPLNPRICFVQPPSVEELAKRLEGRGDTDETQRAKRLAQAKNEIEYCRTEGKNDKVIVNDVRERAIEELEAFATEGMEK